MNQRMSEASVPPELAEHNNWYMPATDGCMRLRDPRYGTPLDLTTPPKFIQADDVLGRGLNFWRKNAAAVEMTNYYSPHRSGVDLGAPGEFESAYAGHDIFGYEAPGNTLDDIIAAKALTQVMGMVGMADSNTSHHFRLTRAILANPQVTALPMDVRADRGSDLELQIGALAERWHTAPAPDATYSMGVVALGNARDWIMLATLGDEIEQAFGPRLPDGTRIGTWAGSSHWDKTRKARCLGLSASSVLLTANYSFGLPEEDPMVRVSRTGIFDPRVDPLRR